MNIVEVLRKPELTTGGVYRLEAGILPDPVQVQILADIETFTNSRFNWQEFVQEAGERWADYIPVGDRFRTDRPTDTELEEITWSHLVSGVYSNQQATIEVIKKAWDVQAGHETGSLSLGRHLVVIGLMGTGKTELAKALHGGNPFYSKLLLEQWEDNSSLAYFYDLLETYLDPLCAQAPDFQDLNSLLTNVQGSAQGHFAACKFIQTLNGMSDLGNGFDLVQDTNLSVTDMVFFNSQAMLRLASQENIEAYKRDNAYRQRLTPPYLRLGHDRSMMVYLWAPLSEIRARIVHTRGREIERQIPWGYLELLYLNTLQCVLAMSQAGAPVLVVDARADFRSFRSDRSLIVRDIWEKMGGIRGQS
ncbi:MAG TPA: deoxynucleoside kinase [Candidatus Bathyarchaeia archaeon]|nr:deoxynucleoside kinase [Candidatus Bathyarchaeia archaeon]